MEDVSPSVWICGYCLAPVQNGEAWHQCPACERVVHEECWEENEGCVTLGCDHHPSSFLDVEAAG